MLDHYGVQQARWIGTSMGGLIGVTLAADVLKDRITHLIINDTRQEIPAAGSERIVGYVGNPRLPPRSPVWLSKPDFGIMTGPATQPFRHRP